MKDEMCYHFQHLYQTNIPSLKALCSVSFLWAGMQFDNLILKEMQYFDLSYGQILPSGHENLNLVPIELGRK